MMENEFKPYTHEEFIHFDSIVDVRYKGVAQPATAVKANTVRWSAVIEWRYSDQQTVEPSVKEPTPDERWINFNNHQWVKFIPGDVAYWNPGDKLDIRYLTGDIHNGVSTEGINWDTVAKYRKSQGVPVEAVKHEPFSTINGEPASKALTTQQGTVVDPNSRYYDAGGIETIEIIKAKLTTEQLKGYLLGNVIKYSSRLNFKGTAQRDAEKLKFYANWLEQLNHEQI